MNRKFRVVFYLRSSYSGKNKTGLIPLRTRIYLNNDRLELGSTGIKVNPEAWDSRRGRCKGRTSEIMQVNNALDRIEADLLHLFRRNEFNECLSLDLIKSEYLGGQEESESFLAFYDEFLEIVKSEVGKSRCYASYQKFNVLKKHFEAFLMKRYKRKDLMMDELNYKIISDLENYLLTDGNCKHNTVMRMMGNFKTITIKAIKMGKLKQDPYMHYKIHFNQTNRDFLSDAEIKVMMKKKFAIPRMEHVRDIFVFSCFTGLAYIDVAQLTEENLVEMDGRLWIMTKRQKTNVPSNILLLDVAKSIIEKYKGQDKKGRLLPILTNQRMNSYLKEIADACGIKKNLTFHIARHTFATLAISKGVPIESVSKMLGHTKIATTQIYARITNKKLEHDMLDLASKLDKFDSIDM